MPAPPYDPTRCSLASLRESLGVQEDDLRVVAQLFGHEIVDGNLSGDAAGDVREWLDDTGGRTVPEWHHLAASGWRDDDSPLHS